MVLELKVYEIRLYKANLSAKKYHFTPIKSFIFGVIYVLWKKNKIKLGYIIVSDEICVFFNLAKICLNDLLHVRGKYHCLEFQQEWAEWIT